MNFFEISQDSAGLFLFSHILSMIGFYTEDVATCIVYAFIGEKGLLAVHDSGQLSLHSILSQIQRIGWVERIICAQNKFMENPIQNLYHKNRRDQLLSAIGFKKHVEEINLPTGSVFLTNQGMFLEGPMASIVRIPDRERRLMINTLNNFFLPRNSQSLPLDLQCKNGIYTPNPEILVSLEKMKARADHELNDGEDDYWYFLNKALEMELFSKSHTF